MLKLKDSIVFMLPVQSLEYWLLYLQKHQRGETVKPNSLEKLDRKEVKKMVYANAENQGKRQDNREALVREVAQHVDKERVEWLQQHSRSFSMFCADMRQCLSRTTMKDPDKKDRVAHSSRRRRK